jgi:hypothetical protein
MARFNRRNEVARQLAVVRSRAFGLHLAVKKYLTIREKYCVTAYDRDAINRSVAAYERFAGEIGELTLEPAVPKDSPDSAKSPDAIT